MEKILAIDPGERVGWAKGIAYPSVPVDNGDRGHGASAEEAPFLMVEDQGVHPLQDFARTLGECIGEYDTVVYETWRLYPGAAKHMIGNDMQPAQLVGIIRYLSWISPKIKLVSQGATIKKVALKTMPDYINERFQYSSEQHDQDALMHLWYYYWKEYV